MLTLKRAVGGNYFDELLARIRDIRSSEKVFYRKVLEIYALSLDYEYVFVLGDRYKRIRISKSSELP